MKRLLAVSAVMAFSTVVSASNVKTSLYGYIEGYVEQVADQPTRSGGTSTSEGEVTDEANAHEFDTPHVNLMMKSSKDNKYSTFLNLDAAGGTVETKNAWVEAKLSGDKIKMRMGKMYRQFGLYNERLDAVPTYIGIEPPELFDGDHLLLTRTTNFMIHGQTYVDGNTLRYSLTTGNEERTAGEVPVGGDVRYTLLNDDDSSLTVGTSFYFSNKATTSHDSVGDGKPVGGVANHMTEDEYKVLGLYLEYDKGPFKFQTAYYEANHDALRDGAKVKTMADTGTFNDEQIERFCQGDTSSCESKSVNYQVRTWYIRTGYTFETGMGEFTPYFQWDFYSNPETVADKSVGGDNEAGIADDGQFTKQTLGFVFKPDSQLAIKVDASNHSQLIDDEDTNYAEVRSSFSYIWSM